MEQNTLGLAHAFLRQHVRAGACCIDATAGRGRDTALLCRLVGRGGSVLAFDIQQQVVQDTRELLASQGLQANVVQDSHVHMERYAQAGTVDAIVFNLGRLPGGDPGIMTTDKTSVAAIDAGLRLLRPGGVMSICIYYGGKNGYTEKDAVLRHLQALDDRAVTVLSCGWLNRAHDPPLAVFVCKHSD